jgi:hypothetical protein
VSQASQRLLSLSYRMINFTSTREKPPEYAFLRWTGSCG